MEVEEAKSDVDGMATEQSTATTGGGDSLMSVPTSTAPASDSTRKAESEKPDAVEIDLTKAPVRQYLEATVVPTLLSALLALARARPASPIGYLASYLGNMAKKEDTAE